MKDLNVEIAILAIVFIGLVAVVASGRFLNLDDTARNAVIAWAGGVLAAIIALAGGKKDPPKPPTSD